MACFFGQASSHIHPESGYTPKKQHRPPGLPLPVMALLLMLSTCLLLSCADTLDAGRFPHGWDVPPAIPDISKLHLGPSDVPPGATEIRFGASPTTSGLEPGILSLITAYLQETLGFPFRLVLLDSYQEIIDAVVNGEVDMVNLAPLSYVLALERVPDLKILVQKIVKGATSYSSLLVVPYESDIVHLGDLRGRRISFVDENSTSGFLFPYAALMEMGMDPRTDFSKIRFAGSHEGALSDLGMGISDVAATYSEMLQNDCGTGVFPKGKMVRIRVLGNTGRIPYDVVCALGNIPPSGAAIIGNALLACNTQSSAGELIYRLSGTLTGWVPVDDSTFDQVRATYRLVHDNRKPSSGSRPTRAGRRP